MKRTETYLYLKRSINVRTYLWDSTRPDVAELSAEETGVVGLNDDICAITDLGVKRKGFTPSSGTKSMPFPTNLGVPDSLSGGYDFLCALKNGKVACWGNNEYGQSDVPKKLAL